MKHYLKKLEDQVHNRAFSPALSDFEGASYTYADLAIKMASLHAFFREAGIKKGDTVFMYVGAPVSAILYKCLVTETGIPYRKKNEHITIRELMRIRLQKRYSPDRFPFSVLKEEFDVRAVRGPRGIPDALSEALKKTGSRA